GFSSILRELGLPQDNLLLALLNFNLGVEAGQAAVVIAVVLVISLLSKVSADATQHRYSTALSSFVLAIGLGLFVERLLFW
ncbi:MAG: HupE/UreJ family protein, partial [Candidatus Competibacteraceae bacterium]|nr:HupE/UreJ family protein [Candidatus Competibacteraceae bacterium]